MPDIDNFTLTQSGFVFKLTTMFNLNPIFLGLRTLTDFRKKTVVRQMIRLFARQTAQTKIYFSKVKLRS